MSVFVARARSLVGTPFRPQGRDAASGIDCIGLAALVYAVPSEALRDDYRLSGAGQGDELRARMAAYFRRVSKRTARAGDLVLMQPAATQWHLGVLTGDGLVHADARRRCVVETPGPGEWPPVAIYRRRVREPGK